ncbi:CGNR zinc finger domain-containing protein [Jatrophihabitans fulvus]
MTSPALRLAADTTDPRYGGAKCLLFVNTVEWRRSDEPVDRMTDVDFLLRLHATYLGEPGDLATLRAAADASPRAAARALARAVALRETVHAVFAATAAGGTPPADELAALDEWVARASARLRLRPDGDGGWLLRLDTEPNPLDLPMHTVALSAAALLSSDRLDRVRACEGPTCGWLFVDSTRNNSRRWCEPGECGNRERVRAHYHRTRQATRQTARSSA